ncbi:hypothetical protein DTO013E5_10172 [Penicillium roqueforti]|nr:hypothetical protein DTO012A1_10211 [Penicillium roqueforti]KAI2734232.1 hypothetical protein DTO013F2_10367 [Penicillium roqueforti]KAI2753693.1 hypothetical protein DTO012A8_9770 [Penicillium roqueforti]KAI3195548.1 hypothetical protein DTO013E5_10172 [Penicillium roqueforti]
MANPLPWDDRSMEPGSASNPILIDITDISCRQNTPEQDDSDGETVRLSTPEFYENLSDGGPPAPLKGPALTDSNPVVTPSRVLNGRTFEFTHSSELRSRDCIHLERKKAELMETSKEASEKKDQNLTSLGQPLIAYSGHPGLSRPGQSGGLGPPVNTSHAVNDNSPPSYGQGSVRIKRKHGEEPNPRTRRSKRLKGRKDE